MAKTFWQFFAILFMSGLFIFFAIGGYGSKLFKDYGLIPAQFVHSSERIMRRAVLLVDREKLSEFENFAEIIKDKRNANILVLDEYGNHFGADDSSNKEPYAFDVWRDKVLPIYRTQLWNGSVKIIDTYEMDSNSYVAIITHKNTVFLGRLRGQLVSTVLLGLTFIILGSLLLARYVVTPLRKLQANVNQFSNKPGFFERDTKNNMLLSRQDAIGDLARSYDVMSQQVSNVLQSQRLALHALSHELRTPLTRLTLMASLAEDDIEKTPELIPQIEKEVYRMNALISRITQLARLESGAHALNQESFSTMSLINACVDGFKLELERTNINIYIHGGDASALYVDKPLVLIALNNLLKNALRYANKQVNIVVKTNDQLVDIIVEDDGLGIDGIDDILDWNLPDLPETQEFPHSVFDAFYRQDSKSNVSSDNGSMDQNNLGLGLSIVNRIMILHGGSVAAYRSKLGGLSIRLHFS